MKKITLLLAVCLFTFTASAQKGKWVKLFDGKNTDHWHSWTLNEVKGWTVEDKVLTTEGKSGDLVTNEKYEDFILEFDFMVSPKGNSGVVYKIIEEPGNKKYFNTYASGPEYQIIDDVNYPGGINNRQKTGANYDIIAPNDLTIAKPAGEWNKGVLKIQDNKVEHWLNGKKVVEYTYGSNQWSEDVGNSKFAKWEYANAHDKGHLSLQGHGDKVSFRKVRIKEL
jgi:hypothetical protein